MHTPMKDAPIRENGVRGFEGRTFVEAIGLAMTLPFLKDLVLKFRTDDGPFRSDNDRDRLSPPEVVLQFLIIRTLGEIPAIPSALNSLTLDNLVPLPHPYLESPAVLKLLSTLTHFAINTTSRCAIYEHQIQSASTSSLLTKGALSSSLVSLQVHHACVRSAEIIFPVSKVHLPRLEYLSFQRIYFSEQGEVEQFIARHSGTLVQLKLFLCPMALSMRRNSSRRPKNFRRWAQVWNHLDRDLKVLKELVVSERHDSTGAEDVGLGRYVDNCYHCNVVKLGKGDMAADDAALKQFQKRVESRSQRP
jgi:hypothetical protein